MLLALRWNGVNSAALDARPYLGIMATYKVHSTTQQLRFLTHAKWGTTLLVFFYYPDQHSAPQYISHKEGYFMV